MVFPSKSVYLLSPVSALEWGVGVYLSISSECLLKRLSLLTEALFFFSVKLMKCVVSGGLPGAD